ncbi:nucleotide exchange factor GrpE [Actinomadura sp. 7K507]|uniref:nucleotide exchange factor GrpE n=1 Tax=Actinomadura sp. 7K507 TaxID=2530365 RepID=UPI0010518088|nr:nucleotide exchange factor GrpE [Actinomadura sp. 7K507]TDC92021.1 nucleotide exchange factor GrpE [Actinomadura sp. 7K507]
MSSTPNSRQTEQTGQSVSQDRPTDQPEHTDQPEPGHGRENAAEAADRDSGEVERLRARVEELEDLRRRALADLDNLRKRMTRELEAQRRAQRAEVTAAWLPVLDDLERALQHAESDPASVIEGVRSVRDRAVATLRDLGYPRRDDLGVPFDPTRHEAVAVRTDPDVPPGTVVEVHQPGYGDDENQLRPALVSVSAKAGD